MPTERVVLVAFLLAGALAGLAGLLIAPQAPIGLEDGVLLGLKGMAAALLAGSARCGSRSPAAWRSAPSRASILASPSLGARWADMIVLALLAVLAATRPRGLLA